MTTNVSSGSLSNASQVSPGANETSRSRRIREIAMRRLSLARFLPGQMLGPLKGGKGGTGQHRYS